MKHLILVLLALMLTGCVSVAPDTSYSATEPPTSIAGSEPIVQPIEIQHNRALSVYDMGISDCWGIYPMGEEMLLLSGSEKSLLTVLSDNVEIQAQKVLPCLPDPAEGTMQINENGIAYYDSLDNAIVYLNTDLLEIQRIPLPDTVDKNILLSPNWDTVYFCSDDAIHALDLQTSIPRMIRKHSVTSQRLTGLHLGGTLLACQVTYEDGYSECLYLSTQTGEAHYQNQDLQKLYTGNDIYFASFRDGSVNLWLTGKPNAQPWMLHIPQNTEITPLFHANKVVIAETTSHTIELNYLNITTGMRSSALTLDTVSDVLHISGKDDIVWFLANAEDSSHPLLYRWTPVWSRVWSPRSYYQTYYTADDPDINGLLRQSYHANVLGNRYGVNILTGKDAVEKAPDGHTFEMEYRIAAYERDLAVLEAALANFPDNFFQNAAFGTKNRKLTVNLVRDLHADGNQETLPGKQYWLNESAYITLVMGPELEQSFYHQLSHIIDTRVMGTTSIYDNWASLNPEGIRYANSYQLAAVETDNAWFHGDSRVFVDPYSMSFPREDRARILEYAMMPGNEEIFASETMQKKLLTLCQGIRQAFELEEDVAYLWEQYLITENK